MEPGIYRDLSNENYHAGPGISKSGISLILDSPQKFKARYIDGLKAETTPAMVIGSATHTAVFEPHLFDAEYAVCPKCDKRTKIGKEVYEQFCASAGSKTIITEDDLTKISAIRDAVRNHPKAGPLVSDEQNEIENSIFCTDEETGLLVKVRPDCIQEHREIIIDLKTTTNSSYGAFSKACFDLTYYIQAGMYLSVARQHGLNVTNFVFVVVEKEPPYAIGIYWADKRMIELGYDEFCRGMKIYAECLSSGVWPGYNNDQVVEISLPKWADHQISLRE